MTVEPHQHTEQFLEMLLGGTDEPAHYRIIHDRDNERAATNIDNSPLNEALVKHFNHVQKGGFGIFIVVNEGGQADKHITGLRACFVDGDGILMPEDWGLRPNMLVVRDQTHWHAYWLLDESEDLTKFSHVQRILAGYYGTDPSVHNLSRVMRVPGFLHQKGKPVQVELQVLDEGRRFTLDEIEYQHPVTEAPAPARALPEGEKIGKGGRHNAFVSAAGGMRNFGFEEAEILAALKTLRDNRTEDPGSLPDEELDKIAKFAGTRDGMDLCMVAKGTEIASRIKKAHDVGMRERTKEVESHARYDPGPLPPELLRPPGLITEVIDYILSQSRKPQPVHALASALSLMGIALAGRVRGPMGSYTSMLNFCVGPTGSGKQAPMDCVKSILAHAEAGDRIIHDMTGDTAIARHLDFVPDAAVVTDEIGQMMLEISQEKSGPKVGVIRLLLTLFSNAGKRINKIYADRKNNIDIPWTCFNLLGFTVPEAFHESLDSGSISSGFLPRCSIFRLEGHTEERRYEVVPPPDEITNTVAAWLSFPSEPDSKRMVIRPDIEATKIFDRFSKECWDWREREEDKRLQELWTRCAEKAERMALCVACSRHGPDLVRNEGLVPVITADDAAYSCALSLHITRQMVSDFFMSISDTNTEKQVKSILKSIVDGGKEGVQKSTLTRNHMRMTARERENALSTLKESGLIVEYRYKKKGRKGPPEKIFVAVEHERKYLAQFIGDDESTYSLDIVR